MTIACLLGLAGGLLFRSWAVASWSAIAATVSCAVDRHDEWGAVGVAIVAIAMFAFAILPTIFGLVGVPLGNLAIKEIRRIARSR